MVSLTNKPHHIPPNAFDTNIYYFTHNQLLILTSTAQSCGSDETVTITAAAAASSIASCTTYEGDISIASGAASGGILDLGDLEEITGDLTYAEDSTVRTITANSLERIGNMNLTNLSLLSSLGMQRLTEIGDMTFIGLGGLNSFNFGNPGVVNAGKITIINTQISSLNGINQAEEIDSLVVSDNQFLSEIGMNISRVGAIDIGPNNVAKGQQAIFPNLGTARFLNFRNCTEVDVSSLGNVSTLFGLYGNYFESFTAPELQTAGGIVINDNSELTNLSFPVLERINNTDNGTLQIANNTGLARIDGFASLETITGDVDINGNIDE